MMAILEYLALALGIRYLIGDSSILAFPRMVVVGTVYRLFRFPLGPIFSEMVYCPACLGWWVGLAIAGLYPGSTWMISPFVSMLANLAFARVIGTTYDFEHGAIRAEFEDRAPTKQDGHDEAST
jgi:hypothetical protein